MAKFVFVTGGVVSALGKGIACASLGNLLKARGLKVILQKFDPYLNVDPGTMNPFQHGEVFVLDTGHRLRFRGAVDDQYGLGYTKDVATRHYLRHALDALIEGEPVQTPATSAPGCVIDADPEKDRLFQPVADGQMIS